MRGLFRCGFHNHQAALQAKNDFWVLGNGESDGQEWQRKSVLPKSVHCDRWIIDSSRACIYDRLHDAGCAAPPLHYDHVPGKVWTRPILLFAVPEDTPSFFHAFPDSCSIPSFKWCGQFRDRRLPCEIFRNRIILKSGGRGYGLCPRRNCQRADEREARSSRHP
jgi:hypothetical protein